MSHSKPRPLAEDRDNRTAAIDAEIAALMAMIEKETVPVALQDLALKLRAALASKRAEESDQGGNLAELPGS